VVSIEEILKRVQQAETETERQWILLELQISQMPDELVSMLWAAAIPHFFDANILAALRPELTEQAYKLYENLKALTFVEEFPKQGYNIHELTRNVLLNQLWQQDKDEFLRLSQRAADYFFSEKMSSEEDVEFCYHEILNEGETQTGRLLDRGIDWWTYHQIERLQAAVQGFREHEIAERLDAFGKGFSFHLQGIGKIRSGRYLEAELFLSRSEILYKTINLKNQRYITALLRDIGTSRRGQGDYDSSVYFYEKSLSISKEQLGENHPDTVNSLHSLALNYQDKGRYNEAEPLFLRALKISEEQLGANHLNTANKLNSLASNYRRKGRYDEEEPLILRALKIYEEQLGENHPDTANILNSLALNYQDKGRYDEAEPLILRALKIYEEQLGGNHPDTANILNNLASYYIKKGQYDEAKPLILRALKIHEEQLGKNHPHTATSLDQLASYYIKKGQYDEAEPLFLRALKIYEEQLGENHPDTATNLNNLAEFYKSQERNLEAIPLLERWKNIKRERQETRNKSYADRIRTLGKLYEKCQQFPQAVAAYKETLFLFNHLLAPKHPQILVLKAELARLKKNMKKVKK